MPLLYFQDTLILQLFQNFKRETFFIFSKASPPQDASNSSQAEGPINMNNNLFKPPSYPVQGQIYPFQYPCKHIACTVGYSSGCCTGTTVLYVAD